MADATVVRDQGKSRYGLRRGLFDVLAVLNVAGLAAAEAFAFSKARPGFVYYALGVLALYLTLWLVLRRHEFPVWASLLLQSAVVGHMAGRFVYIGGHSLYLFVFAGIHMDKVIHAFNTGAGAVFIVVLFRTLGLKLRGWEGFIVVMVACGMAALIEIIEYTSTLVLVTHNVGDYVNNAQDLVANLGGAILGWVVARAIMGPEDVTA